MQRIICYFLALLIFTFISLGFISGNSLGIPDGYISDYHRAALTLFKIIALPSFLLAIYFSYLGYSSTKRNTQKKTVITIMIIVFLAVAYFISDWYLYNHFDHGQGG